MAHFDFQAFVDKEALKIIAELKAENARLQQALVEINRITHADSSWLRCRACDTISTICANNLPVQTTKSSQPAGAQDPAHV